MHPFGFSSVESEFYKLYYKARRGAGILRRGTVSFWGGLNETETGQEEVTSVVICRFPHAPFGKAGVNSLHECPPRHESMLRAEQMYT